jgi:hypothetical protein
MRIEEIRRGLAQRLRERRLEIEQATLTRVHSISDPDEGADPEYSEGLRAAVSVAVAYGIEAIERSEDHPPPMPTALLSQARLAARHGVRLEVVLRRYLVGYTLLGDFLIEESEWGAPLNGASLKRLLRILAALLDRLIAAVSEEYAREAKARPASSEQRRAERVQRLLAGELAYEFDGWHLGVVASGLGAAPAVGELAVALDCRHLVVRRDEVTVWAWFGGRRQTDAEEIERHLSEDWPAQVSLAIGEPGRAFAGWRLTHQQAKATLPIALESSSCLVRYADVALLASIKQDEVLAASLRLLYLVPLATASDGGAALRETLRAYLAAGRNVSSAAAILGVGRRTVTNRIRTVEERIGRPFDECAVELQMALQLDEFD